MTTDTDVDKWTRRMLLCAKRAQEATLARQRIEALDWVELACVCFDKAAEELEQSEKDQ